MRLHKDMDKRTGEYSVYVGNIPRGTSEEKLETLFSQCGTIRGVLKIPPSKGDFDYAFVGFRNFASVEKAVLEMNNWPFQGTKLIVDYSKRAQGLPEYLERKKQTSKVVVKKKGRQYPPTKEDFMYLSRVRDVCRNNNKSAGQDDEVDMNRLLGDMENMECGRGPSLAQDVMNITVDHVLVLKKLQTRPLFCKEDYPTDEAELFLKQRSNSRMCAALDTDSEISGRRKRNRKKHEKDIQINPVLKSKLGKLLEHVGKESRSSTPSNVSTATAVQEASTSSKEEAAACRRAEEVGAIADSSLPSGSQRLCMSTHQQSAPVTENGSADSGVSDAFSFPSTASDNGDRSECPRQGWVECRTPVNEEGCSEQTATARPLFASPGDAGALGQQEDGARQTLAARLQRFRQLANSPCPVTSPGRGPVQNGSSATPPWQNGFGRGILGLSLFESDVQRPGQPDQ